jgi:hypothetical protein
MRSTEGISSNATPELAILSLSLSLSLSSRPKSGWLDVGVLNACVVCVLKNVKRKRTDCSELSTAVGDGRCSLLSLVLSFLFALERVLVLLWVGDLLC